MNIVDTLVVTPTLGNRETIVKTVESVTKFGGERVKHIIGCPKDQIAQLAARFPTVTVVDDGGKKGIYAALNHVIFNNVQAYKYVAYINDDDYWLGGFKSLFDVLDSDESLGIAYGKTEKVDIKGNRIVITGFSSNYRAFPKLVVHSVPMFTQQATLMRVGVFLRRNGFNEKYRLVADTDFWLRCVIEKERIEPTNSICAAYSVHDDQLSANTNSVVNERRMLCEEHNLSPGVGTYLALLKFRIENIPEYISRKMRSQNI